MAERTPSRRIGLFNCSICFQEFKNPKLLPCHHTFCAPCLTDYMQKTNENGKIHCPMCRKIADVPSNGVGGFQTNFYITAARETRDGTSNNGSTCDVCGPRFSAEMRCLDCEENFCSECTKAHMTMKVSRDHNLIELSPDEQDGRQKIISRAFCSKHPNEEIKVMCKKCNKLLCVVCKMTGHEAHSSNDLSDEAAEMRKEISNYLDSRQMKDRLKNLTENVRTLDASKRKIPKDLNADVQVLQDQCQKIHAAIDSAFTEMERELKDKYTKTIQENEEELRKTMSEHAFCNTIVQTARQVLNHGTDVDIIQKGPQLCQQVKKEEEKTVRKYVVRNKADIYNSGTICSDQITTMLGRLNDVNILRTVTLYGTAAQMECIAKIALPNGTEMHTVGKTLYFPIVNGITPVGNGKAFAVVNGRDTIHLINIKGNILQSTALGARCHSLTADKRGNCLVACPDDRTIRRVTKEGLIKPLFTLDSYSHGLAYRVLDDGEFEELLYVGSPQAPGSEMSGAISIVKYKIDGKKSEKYGLCDSVTNVSRVSVDAKFGKVVAASSDDRRVTVLQSDGKVVGQFEEQAGTKFKPHDVCFDREGCVIVANRDGRTVLRITWDGTLVQVLLEKKDVGSLAVDDDNNLWLGLEKGCVEVYKLS